MQKLRGKEAERLREGGVAIECRVSPRSGRSRIKGVRDGALLVALAAPPVEGAANEELIELLSRELGVPRSRISITRGLRGRTKALFIRGADPGIMKALFRD